MSTTTTSPPPPKPPITSIPSTLASFTETWHPRLLARLNDHEVKVAKISGAFIWHSHPDTDELFYILAGEVQMELEGMDTAILKEGDVFVVPRGVRHRPIAGEGGATILMVEREGTVNTGKEGGERTVGVVDVRGRE